MFGIFRGLLQVLLLLLLGLLDLLVDACHIFWLRVVAGVTMATDAAALTEQVLAFADGLSHIAANQHHVRGMTRLAAGLNVLFREQRPQPVLVITVRLLH